MLNVEPCNLSCRTMNKQIQEGKGEGSADFLESFKISQSWICHAQSHVAG